MQFEGVSVLVGALRMIEESVIRTVIERTDIVRLVGEYVQLKRRGGRLVGLCPFHREKTPSFSVNPDHGAFYCFGCHEGGSAVDFLMKLENLSFPEAIEKLAEKLGIEVVYTHKSNDNSRQNAKIREKQFLEVMQSAQNYFERELQMPNGEICRNYAKNRGISETMIKSFGLGFSPEGWTGIVDHLKQDHCSLEDARELGIVASRESGGYYARFRNRLMFPVHNVRGEIIAFGGRILDKSDTAKYINSPESHIYTKGEHLYGLFQAKMHITREHCAILVEGNVDVVMMHGFGFCHTVASMGTALTPKQAALLYRHTKRVYLMYDGDNAGRKAMTKALGVLLGQEFEGLYAVELPKNDDPDSYLRTYGAKGMNELIANAKPLGMWCVQKKCDEILMLPPELRKSGFAELSDLLHEFPDKLTQVHYLEEAARFLGQDSRQLAIEVGMELSKSREGFATQKTSVNADDGKQKFDQVEWNVVYLALTSERRFENFVSQHGMELIQDPALRTLMAEYIDLPNRQNPWEMMSALDENSRKLYEKIICSEPEVSEEDLDLWFIGAMAKLIRKWASCERLRIGNDIADAVKRGDMNAAAEFTQKDQELLRLIQITQKDRQYRWQRDS